MQILKSCLPTLIYSRYLEATQCQLILEQLRSARPLLLSDRRRPRGASRFQAGFDSPPDLNDGHVLWRRRISEMRRSLSSRGRTRTVSSGLPGSSKCESDTEIDFVRF